MNSQSELVSITLCSIRFYLKYFHARNGEMILKDEEIVRRINSFPYWQYQFNLKGHLTPISHWAHWVNRQLKRRKYILDPVVKLCDGSLKGKRVLDLGCNSGFWSLCAIQEGADFVLGIDARKMFVEQANFVFKVNEVDRSRYNFIAKNLFNIDFREFGIFDIVLCLGLLYHVYKPMSLLEKIAEVNDDILVIDTVLSMTRGSYMEVLFDRESWDSYVERKLVMRPTKQVVFNIVKEFGYSSVMLRPRFTDWLGLNDYRVGRRAFLCTKKMDLSKLPAEFVEDIDSDSRMKRVYAFLQSGMTLLETLRDLFR